MRNAGLDDSQAGIKIARRNVNKLRYASDTTLRTKSEEELKSLLMRVREESKKSGLNLNIQKTKIMASSPITSWKLEGETVKTVTDFIFWDSKITVNGDCSHEIQTYLPLGRRALTKLDSVLKSRDITLLTKVCILQAMIFPVVMYECEILDHKEGWAPKNWCFQIVVLRTARRSNQSVLKEINPEYPLEALMLKLKLQYSGHLMWRANSLEKTLMLGKIEGRRRRGRPRMRWLDGIIDKWPWVWANSGR